PGGMCQACVLSDVNADGISDLIGTASAIVVMLGDGSGHFHRVLGLPVWLSGVAVAVGDLDRDSLPDIVGISVGDIAQTFFTQLSSRSDTNDSNRTDGFDVSAVGRLAGSRPCSDADPGCGSAYRRNVDVNLDGVIDGDDLSEVARQFGRLRRSASPL